MINYCLNKVYLEDFLKYQFSNGKFSITDENLAAIIDNATNWTSTVNLVVYFFSTYAQRRINAGEFNLSEVENFYEIANYGNYQFQQFDREFIEYLLDHSRSKMNMTLEEIIVKIQEDLADRNYGSRFRY